MWMSCGKHIHASETMKSAYFNMPGFALPNFRQGNLGHPGLSMHASDPCDEEIQNHRKKISYHHNVTPSMIDFPFRHKGSLSRQSKPILSGITLPHLLQICFEFWLFQIILNNYKSGSKMVFNQKGTPLGQRDTNMQLY